MKGSVSPPFPTLMENLFFSEAVRIQNVLNSFGLKIPGVCVINIMYPYEKVTAYNPPW